MLVSLVPRPSPYGKLGKGLGTRLHVSNSTIQLLTLLLSTTVVKDVCEITEYLLDLEKIHIYHLGLELGLAQPKLKDMKKESTFRDDVIAAWVRMEDNVIEKGKPSWTVLVSALRQCRVGQTGIARKIERDKGL